MKNLFAVIIIAFACSPSAIYGQQIPAGYFGLHRQCTAAINPATNENYNSDCGTLTVAWPSVPTAVSPASPFGMLRLWDTQTKFGDIAASSDSSQWYWGALDQNIREARANGAEVLWVPEGKTPSWACPSGSGCSPSSVPTDTNLENFLNAVLSRALDTSTGQVCTSGATCRPMACQSSGTWAGITTGCIGYIETWNEPNTGGSYSGTTPQLVHIERITYQSAHQSGLNVKVVSPAFTYAGAAVSNACTYTSSSPEAYTCVFLTATGSGSGDLAGKDYADIVGFHDYPAVNQSGTTGILASTSTTTGIAEATLDNRVNGMIHAMTTDGVTLCAHGTPLGTNGCKELWNTEYSWGVLSDGSSMNTEVQTATCSQSAGCPRINPSNDASSVSPQSTCPNTLGLHGYGCWANDQGAFVVKTMALGWSLGLSRNIWYWWGPAGTNTWGAIYCATVNAAIGCNHTGIQTAGLAYGSVENWLVGLTQTSPCTISSNIWTCDYSGPSGYTARIVWDSSLGPGETEYYPTTGFTRSRDMLGNVSSPLGTQISIGYAPILLESGTRLTPDFSLTAAPATQTVTAGQNASLTITTSGVNGDTANISLTCTTPVSGCSFSSASVTPGSSSTLSVAASALAVGSNTITVSASDGTNTHTASATVTVTAAADFSVSASPGSASVSAGQSATYTVTISPAGGFNSAVSLSCSGAPSKATCTLSPSSVTPSGASVTSTLMIATTAPSAMTAGSMTAQSGTSEHPSRHHPWRYPVLSAGLLPIFLLKRRWRERVPHWTTPIMLALVVGALSSCGGGGSSGGGPSNPGTPTGASTITVTATSGALSHSTTVTLNIN